MKIFMEDLTIILKLPSTPLSARRERSSGRSSLEASIDLHGDDRDDVGELGNRGGNGGAREGKEERRGSR